MFDAISLEILWSRLASIADEGAATMMRTSFSTIVREANDLACVLHDAEGRSLAQSSASIPSFIGTVPRTVRHFRESFPEDQLSEGDILVTNDPWLGTGHLPDITLGRPIFRQGRIVGYSGTVAHAPDIGGKPRLSDAREVFEEGIRLPPMKLYRAGRPNDDVFRILLANVRMPDQLLGDIRAQVSANEVVARRLKEVMDDYSLPDLVQLSAAIRDRSERAMRTALSSIPNGTYSSELATDGYTEPIVIKCRVTINNGEAHIDYTGSPPESDRGLNVVPSYAFAYSAFAIRCVAAPSLPNNEGAFVPISVFAPEGSILNPRYPAAVGGRRIVGHYLCDAVLAALSVAVPDRVQAGSGSLCTVLGNGYDSTTGERRNTFIGANGGQGAGFGRDGLSCRAFPSNIRNVPVEVVERDGIFRIEKKELITDSGGRGRFRGGLAQEIRATMVADFPVVISIHADRTRVPAKGLSGGSDGALAAFAVNDTLVNSKDQHRLMPGDSVTFRLAGGGGVGDPGNRDRASIDNDLEAGYVSDAGAGWPLGEAATNSSPTP